MIKFLQALTILFVLLYSPIAIAKQKLIYGVDNRRDIFEITDQRYINWASSTAAMINPARIINIKNINYIVGSTLEQQGICLEERFTEQMAAAKCTGFLVGPDTIVTAGHCFKEESDCANYKWVFGFSFTESNTSDRVKVLDDEIYGCSEVLAMEFGRHTKMDYAVIKLDRKVLNRSPLKFRKEGKVSDDAKLLIIGHPSGVPTKVADGAVIRSNTHDMFFMSNLDSFHANSGSPVINETTGLVEGILVRGDEDYSYNLEKNCREVNICLDDECRGEDITRITHLPLDK